MRQLLNRAAEAMGIAVQSDEETILNTLHTNICVLSVKTEHNTPPPAARASQRARSQPRPSPPTRACADPRSCW